MDSQEFSNWRKRVGLTQDGVAERLKVSRSTVQNWANGTTPISHVAEQVLATLEHRLQQENGALGPVTLTYADGPMWLDATPSRRVPMLQMEAFRTNSAALGRVLELAGSQGFHVPFVVMEGDEVLWNSTELSRVISGQDEAAPIPVRWKAKVIAEIADYMRKVAVRFPVRSGPRVWTAEETAAWEGKLLRAVDALDALAAEVPAGTVTLRGVEEVLTDLRELSAFPTHELHHQLVAAFL